MLFAQAHTRSEAGAAVASALCLAQVSLSGCRYYLSERKTREQHAVWMFVACVVLSGQAWCTKHKQQQYACPRFGAMLDQDWRGRQILESPTLPALTPRWALGVGGERVMLRVAIARPWSA